MRQQQIWKRFIALAFAALCALTALPALSEAGIQDSDITDDGVVRVYLLSLSAPKSLNLTLDGIYTVEHDAGFRFARGTQIALSDGGDGIWMDVGGLSLNMGAALTLTRQADGDAQTNGLRIAETGRDTLYAGDLSVSLEDNGGLRAVLAINMEDYLRGVIAYEMSDSWPVEALKAQAVAARTYAMRSKLNAGNRDYDLVDTTGDQVFRGYNPEYLSVNEAVEATEGVVGTYNGTFATCYYSASNGGQTALPSDVWNDDGDYGYLARTEDPYDLENSNSMVTQASFTFGAVDQPELLEMLQAGLEDSSGIDGINFDMIQNVELAEPVAEGSIVCRKLRFTLSATVPVTRFEPVNEDVGAPSAVTQSDSANLALYAIDYLRRLLHGSYYEKITEPELLDQEFTVDLDIYDQIKDGLGLALNGGDYEVASIVDDPFGYTIEMRRFGHGVGMSQRGAQTMAGVYGMRYTEILNFYYPGMTLEKIAWQTPALESLDELPEGVGRARPEPTPAPTPGPLPELEEGEYYARILLDDTTSVMNLRQNPTTQAPVVARLSHNQRVIVHGEPDADGWVEVHTAEYSGYAKIEYLTEE